MTSITPSARERRARLQSLIVELDRQADAIAIDDSARGRTLRRLIDDLHTVTCQLGTATIAAPREPAPHDAHRRHIIADMMSLQLGAIADDLDDGEPVDADLCRQLSDCWELHRPRPRTC